MSRRKILFALGALALIILSTPVLLVSGSGSARGPEVEAIAAGANHMCAITSRQDSAMLAGGPFLGCAGGPLP